MALTLETESRIYRSLRTIFGATAHLVSLGFTIFVAVLARPGSSLFSWHPLLMSLAFSFLMTEALLVFSPESSLLRSFSRKARARFHWALQLLSLTCAILGLAIISYNKYLNGKDHFVTWHGQTGLLTVFYASMQCMGGVALLYPKLMKNWTLGKLKLYHATSGLIGYLLGCASLMLGMSSLWFTAAVTGVSWYLSILCPILTSLVVMNQVSNAYLYRKRIQP
ncbi:transmembrane reductase CYB561D2 [Anolis carolinensis]|uniref:ascorbate ferrireductase (transmembrane) n=1 Tax=Anolis carolinensis TaxID=28377 RepID=G1KG04_ANOCA|nr:PREDICTED: cytochrome b561 domain-containing protein 2 [Anolis carolinensis]XP_008103257.1 PREDICTED: cytochrome b561 domain-containing protein 2 [Anolis carolinensis]|eukprot:XP_003217609.1 PREDICTED: cytochrome b561 domain-containing protein 2 [Anolis carolinensis]